MAGQQDRALLGKHLRLAMRHVGGALYRAGAVGDQGLEVDLTELYSELARVSEHIEEARPPIRGQTRFLVD